MAVIGVGIDLVDVERFRRTIERTPSLPGRLFREAERRYAESARDPAVRYAARFAAKEAVMKALGVGLGAFAMRDVEVVRDEASGRPGLALHGTARRLAEEAGVARWDVSLSHTDLTAAAVVVAHT